METPNKQNLNALLGSFKVQEILGRPTKRYNLIIKKPEGDYFSSSDNRLELVKYLKKLEDNSNDINIKGWSIYYLITSLKSEERGEGVKYYMVCSTYDFEKKLTGGQQLKLDKYQYVSVSLDK